MSDRLKPSRLELRLEAEVEAAPTSLEADCKRAELAGYQARLGRVADAKSTLAALHQRYDSRPHVAISAWLNLVEGLIGHFSDMDPAARDKVLRAHALSTAAGLTPMRALSAAWLAHLDYSRLDVEAMRRHLVQAFEFSHLEQDSVRSRADLVVAQSLHLAGRYNLALPWYMRARMHASREGDDATVSAVLHNTAWLHMSTLRQASFSGRTGLTECAHTLTSAESTRNFDELFGVSSLAALEPILRAQVHSLMGSAAEAFGIYATYLPRAGFRGALRLRGNLLADQAWCRIVLGDNTGALEDALAASSSLSDDTQVDDLAAAHSRLAQVFNQLGHVQVAVRHMNSAAIAWRSFSDLQDRILELLVQFSDG